MSMGFWSNLLECFVLERIDENIKMHSEHGNVLFSSAGPRNFSRFFLSAGVKSLLTEVRGSTKMPTDITDYRFHPF